MCRSKPGGPLSGRAPWGAPPPPSAWPPRAGPGPVPRLPEAGWAPAGGERKGLHEVPSPARSVGRTLCSRQVRVTMTRHVRSGASGAAALMRGPKAVAAGQGVRGEHGAAPGRAQRSRGLAGPQAFPGLSETWGRHSTATGDGWEVVFCVFFSEEATDALQEEEVVPETLQCSFCISYARRPADGLKRALLGPGKEGHLTPRGWGLSQLSDKPSY